MNDDYSGVPEIQNERKFPIDREQPPTTKSKDKVKARLNRDATETHNAHGWGGNPVVFDVENETKNNTYQAAVFIAELNGQILSTCTCPARMVCKHIVEAWKVLLVLEENDFIDYMGAKNE
jgi:hypothetical protein